MRDSKQTDSGHKDDSAKPERDWLIYVEAAGLVIMILSSFGMAIYPAIKRILKL